MSAILHARTPLVAIVVALVCAVILVICARPFLHHAPLYDELLHVFAARGVVATGEPVIGDGVYPRGELYTRTAAVVMEARNDDGPLSTRLPALAAGAALVALISMWTTLRLGLLAGAAAGALLAFSPLTIELSVFARFYTMHALALSAGAIAVFELLFGRHGRVAQALIGIAGATGAGIALHLQITTVIGLCAIVAAVLAVLAIEPGTQLNRSIRARPVFMGAIAALLLIAACVAGWQLGLFRLFGEEVLWSADTATQPNYYNRVLARLHPLLWPLTPLAAFVAWRLDRRLAVFCLVYAASALAVHSFAAQKASRYAYYTLPFVAVLWAMGLAGAIAFARAQVSNVARRVVPTGLLVAVMLLAATFILSQGGQRSLKLLMARTPPSQILSYADEADWSGGGPALLEAARKADAVVVSNALKGLYYLGDYDYELNASTLSESTMRGGEFVVDSRTGREAISQPESIDRVIAENPLTLIVVEAEKLGAVAGVAEEVVARIRAQCAPADVPVTPGVLVWACIRVEAQAQPIAEPAPVPG